MRIPVSVPGLGAALCLELVGRTQAGHSLQVKGPLWDGVGLEALPGAEAAAGQRCGVIWPLRGLRAGQQAEVVAENAL